MLQRQHRNAPPSVPLSQNNTSSQWGGVKSELKNMRTFPEMGIVKRSTSLEPYDTVDGLIPNGRRRGVHVKWKALPRRLAQEGFLVDPWAPILTSLNMWTTPSGHSISGCFHGYTQIYGTSSFIPVLALTSYATGHTQYTCVLRYEMHTPEVSYKGRPYVLTVFNSRCPLPV